MNLYAWIEGEWVFLLRAPRSLASWKQASLEIALGTQVEAMGW